MFPTGLVYDLLHLLPDPRVPQVNVLQLAGFGRVDTLSEGLQTGAAPEVIG